MTSLGKAAEGLDRITELLKPEAVYAAGEDGQRALFVIFDLADSSQLPVIVIPTNTAFRDAHNLGDVTVVADAGVVSEANRRAIEAGCRSSSA
jgi:hypothetical protein